VLADHVLVEQEWAIDCARLFADVPAYLIGIHCPLEVLEERERQRHDRTLGQARLQFPVIHKYVIYDLEVDTSLSSAAECADAIIQRLALPPVAFKRMNPE
jgi:chloramphenicol 3-O phosphotransferase